MAPAYLRRVEAGRLKYFGRKADADFWSEQWTAERARRYYAGAERGQLGHFEEVFTSFLPREGRLLEAGCGLGHLVVALCRRGYDCEGVEWSRSTVETVRRQYPELPVRVGDVTDLDVADCTYRAVISIGVVEHREAGPQPFLEEARRVLEADGLLLVSVPWFNPLRCWKARLGAYRTETGALPFYQQAFTADDLRTELERAGFDVMAQTGYHAALGLTSEVPGTSAALKMPGIARLRKWLDRSRWANRVCAHMLMLVCRPRRAATS